MDCIKRIWYLSPMRAGKVQVSLRIRAVSPEPSLLAHTSSVSRGTFRQKARSLAPLNGWACAVEICHDGMLEDTNSLDGAQVLLYVTKFILMCVDLQPRNLLVWLVLATFMLKPLKPILSNMNLNKMIQSSFAGCKILQKEKTKYT